MDRARRVSLILVTDPRWSDERITTVARSAAACVPGFSVQLRDRTERADDDLVTLATALREITSSSNGVFIVNRRLALARRVGADGFHAPAPDLDLARDFAWRSAPAHGERELLDAREHGATAAFVSPIFTSSKLTPVGVSALRAARKAAPELTLVALGGIDAENAHTCYSAGADAVAVIRALLAAHDPAHVAKSLARA